MRAMGSFKKIVLGDCLYKVEEYNTELKYDLSDIRGVSNDKRLMPTKANMEGRDLSKFQIVAPGCFVFNRRTTRNGERIGMGYNLGDKTIICTEDYVVFKVNEEYKDLINPTYLYLFFCRDEFDRLARYYSWGSATEFFNWEDMQRVMTTLPEKNIQDSVVSLWLSLQSIKEKNSQISLPLFQLCRSFIQEIKHRRNDVKEYNLGSLIKQRKEKNNGLDVPSYGVCKDGFIEPKQKDADTRLYNVFYRGDFVYNPARMEINSIAQNNFIDKAICSSLYEIFYVDRTDILDPGYLNLYVKRDEFARHCAFLGSGSAREYCRMEELSQIKIILPPIEEQKAISAIFQCAQEAKQISDIADKKSKEICPALIQYAINH